MLYISYLNPMNLFQITGFDNLEFPLLFTNNTGADPVQDNKWTTFSEWCRMFANEGLDQSSGGKHHFCLDDKCSIWQSPTENGRENEYTPCPPELMKDRFNPVTQYGSNN